MKIIDWKDGLYPSEGIYRGMPSNVYHALGWPLFAHSSNLKELAFSEAHFIERLSRKEKPTADMIQGSAIHEGVLEGRDLSGFIGIHRLDWKTVAGRNEKNFLFDRFGEDKILKVQEFLEAESTIKAISANQNAARILSHAQERELTGVVNIGGAAFCVRLDAVGDGFFVDLKTTRRGGASYAEFKRTIGARSYHVQAALYRRVMNALGADLKTMIFIVAEKEAPFSVATYELDEEAFQRGDAFLDEVIPRIAALQAGEMPKGYDERTLKIGIEAWV